jgi:PAS domain S-box-containing protein
MSSQLFQWRSLKTRVTLFTLIIFVLSIGSLTFYSSRLLKDDLQRVLGEQQFATVSVMATEVNEELRDRLAALEQIAKQIDAHLMGNPAALQTLLEQRPILQILFNGGIFVTGPDGTAIADVPLSAGRIGTNYMDRESVSIPLKEGKTVIGKPAMGKKLGAPIFSMVAPIRDGQGSVIGALVATVNLGKPSFLDKITQSRYGQSGGYLLIAPQHNLFVTATDKSRIMQPLPAAGLNAMHDRFMQGHEGFGVAVSSRGVPELLAAKGIPAAGWFVAAALPTQEAFAPIDAMLNRMLLSALFVTLLAGTLTWWLITRMLQRQLAPMLAASRALATLATSDQPVQALPVTRQDEIGELIGGFNRLLETLRTREQALRLKQNMLARTEGIAHVGSWEWDVATDTVKWSDEMFRIFQRNPTEGAPTFAEHPALNFCEDMQRLQDVVGTALSQGTPYELELRAIRSDGATRVCLARGHVEMDSGKRVTHLFGSLQDITARKRLEEALRYEKEFADSLIDTAQVIILVLDTAGHIVRFNPYFEQLSGYSLAEVKGKVWMDTFLPERDKARIRAVFDSAAHGQGASGNVNPIVTRQGAERFIEWYDKPLVDDAGNVTGLLAVGLDITDRRRAEGELEKYRLHLESMIQERTAALTIAKEAAEAANIAKSAFLANMSHEIRTPMNGIIGMAHILRREGVTPQQAKRLDTIDASAQHLLSVINDVLDISKIEAGKLVLEEAPIVVSSLLVNVESILAERAKTKGIQLRIETEHLPYNLVAMYLGVWRLDA